MSTGLKHNGTPTSIAAANSVTLTKVQQDRKAIVTYVASLGPDGACDDEIQRACPLIHTSALRARRGECVDYGLVSAMAGQLNRTASKKQAQAYHVTLRGLAALGLDSAEHWAVDRGAM